MFLSPVPVVAYLVQEISDVGAPQPGMSRSNISPIVTEILELGRIPKRLHRGLGASTKEERDEDLLAQRYAKKTKHLSDLDRLQLATLPEESTKRQSTKRQKLEKSEALWECMAYRIVKYFHEITSGGPAPPPHPPAS